MTEEQAMSEDEQEMTSSYEAEDRIGSKRESKFRKSRFGSLFSRSSHKKEPQSENKDIEKELKKLKKKQLIKELIEARETIQRSEEEKAKQFERCTDMIEGMTRLISKHTDINIDGDGKHVTVVVGDGVAMNDKKHDIELLCAVEDKMDNIIAYFVRQGSGQKKHIRELEVCR